MEPPDPTEAISALLRTGEPTTLTAIAEELGVSRPYMYTVLERLKQSTGCPIPTSNGRPLYTTALRELLREVRQSSLPMPEALVAHLGAVGIHLSPPPIPADRVTTLEARVHHLEEEVHALRTVNGRFEERFDSVQEAFETLYTWGEWIEQRLRDIEADDVAAVEEKAVRPERRSFRDSVRHLLEALNPTA